MLSNEQVEEKCKSRHIKLNFCSFKDYLPTRKYKNFNGIINLQSSMTNGKYNVGTHWLGLVIRFDNAFYFDSFGEVAPQEVLSFVKLQQVKHFAYNTKEIQNLNDSHCGWFCIGLLNYLKGSTKDNFYQKVDEYLNMFSDDTKLNAKILENYLNF